MADDLAALIRSHHIWCTARRFERVAKELDRITALEAELERYRRGLEGIANSACCEGCNEAKLVAKSVLHPPPIGSALRGGS